MALMSESETDGDGGILVTRILAIEGTDIRREIKDCTECLCGGDEYAYCQLNGKDVSWLEDDVAKHCPLPEKVVE